MWQLFTESARKVVFFAQEEAQKYGEAFVSTEHLLLGLMREECLATKILKQLNVEPQKVVTELVRDLPKGTERVGSDMSLTPRSKRVIDLAYDEARDRRDRHIGTEHLLLGLIREGDGLAAKVLEKCGAKLKDARRVLAGLTSDEPRTDIGSEPVDPPQPPRQKMLLTWPILAREASYLNLLAGLPDLVFRTELLLLVCLQDKAVQELLAKMQVEEPVLRAALQAILSIPNEGLTSPSMDLSKFLVSAEQERQSLGDASVTAVHVLLALLQQENSPTVEAFEAVGVRYETVKAALSR